MDKVPYKKYTCYVVGSIYVLAMMGFMFLFYNNFSVSGTSFYEWMSFYREIPQKIISNKDLSHMDFAFVGSSRTRYFIDPYFFKKNHVSILNAGVDGLYYPSFSGVLKQVYFLHPKAIIVSINVGDLTSPKWSFDRPLRIDDMVYLARHAPFVLLDKAFYQKIMPGPLLSFMINRMKGKNYRWDKDFVDCSIYTKNYLQTLELPQESYQYIKGCKNVFSGVLLKRMHDEPAMHIVPYKKLDERKVRYFKSLFHDIEKRGIIPVLVLQSFPGFSYALNMDDLKKTFDRVFVIDMTGVLTKPSDFVFWADAGHVNVKGRYYYTKALYDALKPVALNIRGHKS